MARRLLPAAVLIPLILGALRFSSERHGYFGIEAGISLFAFSNIVLFTAVIQGRVTEFLDVEAVLLAVDPDLIEAPQPAAAEA